MSSDEKDKPLISEPVHLSKEVYAEGGDLQLKCCSTNSDGGAIWVTVSEVIYDLSGEPGGVVRNKITFELGDGKAIEVDLLNGRFVIRADAEVTATGRKAMDLLIKWQGLTFAAAFELLAKKYSLAKARAVAEDYITVLATAFEESRVADEP